MPWAVGLLWRPVGSRWLASCPDLLVVRTCPLVWRGPRLREVWSAVGSKGWMPLGTDMVCHVGLDAVRVSHLVDSVRTSFATGVVRHPHSCVYVTEPPEALYLCVCMCTYSYSSVHLYIYIHTDRDIHIPCISPFVNDHIAGKPLIHNRISRIERDPPS